MRTSRIATLVVSLATLLAAFIFLYPLFWMVLGSFKSNSEIFNTRVFWPMEWTGQYFGILFSGEYLNFERTLFNSIAISISQGVGATILASMAGYIIGTYQFRGRMTLVTLGFMVVLIPAQMVALPLFVWVNALGLFDNPLGVALPGMVSGLGLLFFARVFRLVPKELIEVARMEGASEWRTFLSVLPLGKPFLIAFGFVHFVLAWHAHVIPMLILHSEEARTLPISLAALYGSSLNSPQAVLMAGSTIGMIPLITLFAMAYPQLKSALQEFVAS